MEYVSHVCVCIYMYALILILTTALYLMCLTVLNMALCYCYGTSRGKGHCMTYLCRHTEGRGIAPVHLKLGIRRRWVVSTMLYPWGSHGTHRT